MKVPQKHELPRLLSASKPMEERIAALRPLYERIAELEGEVESTRRRNVRLEERLKTANSRVKELERARRRHTPEGLRAVYDLNERLIEALRLVDERCQELMPACERIHALVAESAQS